MTSCAVSCCICFPKVSCASATSVFSPTASVPPPCRFASNHCGQPQNNYSSEILPPPSSATLGAVLNVVPRWPSSKPSRPLKFNFALRHWPHETTLPTRILCVLRLAPHLSLLFPTKSLLLSSSFAFPTTLSFPPTAFSPPSSVCLALQHSLGRLQHRSFPQLNLHKAASTAITGGFLHVAASKARIHRVPLSTSCPLALPIQP